MVIQLNNSFLYLIGMFLILFIYKFNHILIENIIIKFKYSFLRVILYAGHENRYFNHIGQQFMYHLVEIIIRFYIIN